MKKRNKIIAVCASVFAVISVATVGFATWLVGVTQTSLGLGVETQVDSVQNETQYVEATVAEGTKITVAEKEEHKRTGKNIVGASANDGEAAIQVDENALTFSFELITVRIGKNATTPPTKVVITLDNEKSTANQVTQNLMTETYRPALEEGNYWTYLALEPITLTLSTDFNPTDSDTYTTYTLKEENKLVQLSWGTFFGGDEPTNPVAYYNGLVDDQGFEELLNMSDHASAELTKMNEVLSAGTLTINVALQV